MASNIQIVAPGFQPTQQPSDPDLFIPLQKLIDQGQYQDAATLFFSILEKLREDDDRKKIYIYAISLIPYFNQQQRVDLNNILPQLFHQAFTEEYENLAREFAFWCFLDNIDGEERQKFYVKSIDKFLAQYISNPEHFIPKKVKKLYDYLDKLIPEMTEQNIQALKSYLRKFLESTVNYPHEQYQLARQLALWYSKLAQGRSGVHRYGAYTDVIFYCSQAIRIAKNISKQLCKAAHLFTSQFLGESYFCNQFFLEFEKQIKAAFNTRDEKEIEKLLSRIEDLRKFNLHCSFYGSINSHIAELQPSFSKDWRTPKIEKMLQNGSASALAFSQEYATENYQAKMQEIREFFIKFNRDLQISKSTSRTFIVNLVRSFQRFIFTKYQSLFRMFFEDAFLLLGPPPCSFDLRAMGSLGREEPCPFSDGELFLIFQDSDNACELEKRKEYFTNLARVLALQIESLGEAELSSQDGAKFTCFPQILIKGLMWDGKNFESCINTPANLAHLQNETFPGDPNTLEHMALKSSSLFFFGSSEEVSQDLALTLTSEELTQEEQQLIKKWSVDSQNPGYIPPKTAESSVYLDYQRELKAVFDKDRSRLRHERMLSYLEFRVEDYNHLWGSPFCFPQDIVDLKKNFSSLLHNLLADLAAYWDIKATNTIDLIEALVASHKLTRSSGALLQEAAATIYTLRLSLHLMSGEACDVLTLQKGKVIPPSERIPREKNLERYYWIILIPLYTALASVFKKMKIEQEKSFEDLFAQPFDFHLVENILPSATLDPPRWKPFISRLVAYLIDSHAHETVHEKNFRKLSEHLATEPLREAYWIACKEVDPTVLWFQKLEMFPNRAGFRYASQSQAEALRSTILGLSESPCECNSIEYVKITGLFAGERFLDPSMIEQLIDLNPDSLGHIKRDKGGYHNVSSAVCCHFKELPTDPLMEYAVHDFLFRIAGDLTPPTELVRFEVKIKPDPNYKVQENPLVYPVLISKTIPGLTLADQDLSKLTVDKIDWVRWTWMLLGSILVRTGDGLLQNYILHQEKIYCIDNDSAFVEPVVKFIRSKIQFCSALFCLFQNEALDRDALQEFCKLDPSAILKDWIEIVLNKDKAYLESKLFRPEELRKFYEKDEKNRSRTVALIERQTLVTLCLQFYRLQNYLSTMLKAKEPVTCLSLIEQLIYIRENAIETYVGEYVSSNYRIGCQKFGLLKDQLAWITSRDPGQTYSSEQSRRLPTFDEIQRRTKLSPHEAKEVLYSTLLCRGSNNHFLGKIHELGIAQVDFSSIKNGDQPDTERQKGDLSLLNFLVNGNSSNPFNIKAKLISLSLTHCAALDFKSLEPFLHDTLEHLDIRFCPKITDSDLVLIQRKCTRLKRLYLSGCSELRNLCSHRFLGPLTIKEDQPLSFPALEVLEISEAAKLQEIRLNSPLLGSIIGVLNPLLRIVKINPEKIPKWRFNKCPLFLDHKDEFIKIAKRALDRDGLKEGFFSTLLPDVGALSSRAQDEERLRSNLLSLFFQLVALEMHIPALWNCASILKRILHIFDRSYQTALLDTFNALGNSFTEEKGFSKDLQQAFKWYFLAADSEHPKAQCNLGFCYENGQGVSKDEKEAVKWYRKAADQGHAGAQYNVGFCYEKGQGISKDEKEAVKWYRKAAEQGHAGAQNNLGICYEKGQGVARNEEKAVEWYQKAAKQGHAGAQNNFGACLKNGRGVPKNEEQAVQLFWQAAKQGHAEAQFNLGLCLENGRGVPKDRATAANCYHKAAVQGHIDAQHHLGIYYLYLNMGETAAYWLEKAAQKGHAEAKCDLGIYYNNSSSSKDKENALQLFWQAANQGYADAQFNLGLCFGNGQGVSKDEERAFEWYQKAAEQGHVTAQFNLGWRLANGLGVPKNEKEAIVQYRKAADQGHADAQNNLGVCYEKGQGVPVDDKQAINWYLKAADQGSDRARSNLRIYYNKKGPEEAMKWIKEAAKRGYDEDQFELGVRYDNGEGVSIDKGTARYWYQRAADQGHAAAQNNLGVFYSKGEGVSKNKREACYWFRRAAEQGHAIAQNNLGVCYENGEGGYSQILEAADWYGRAAGQGNADAQNNLGICYEKGRGVPKNEEQAVQLFWRAAKQGHAGAQNNLGICYEKGRGVPKNEEQAVQLFWQAAKQGHAGAQNNLGICYEKGRGVPKNEEQAVQLFWRAAKQGRAEAQFNLGLCLENGRGVPKDGERAFEWYQKAAEKGHVKAQYRLVEAQYRLGVCYENGRGVPKDEEEAVAWYETAAEQGHVEAQYRLGVCYENGKGISKNEEAAAYWYRKAARQGNLAAQDKLVKKTLT